MRRIKNAVFFLTVSVVDEDDDAAVLGTSDNASRRLQNRIHAGVGVCVILTALGTVLEIIADNIPLRGKSGEYDTDDQRTYQPASGEVNTLGKASA